MPIPARSIPTRVGAESLSTGTSTELDTHGREAALRAPTLIREDQTQPGKCCVSSSSIRSHSSLVRVSPFAAHSYRPMAGHRVCFLRGICRELVVQLNEASVSRSCFEGIGHERGAGSVKTRSSRFSPAAATLPGPRVFAHPVNRRMPLVDTRCISSGRASLGPVLACPCEAPANAVDILCTTEYFA